MLPTSTARLGLAGLGAGLLTLIAVVAVTGGAGGARGVRPHVAPDAVSPAPAPASEQHAAHAATSDESRPTPPRARRLIRQTRRAADRWERYAVARRDGFRSIGDAITGHEHVVSWPWAADDVVLDARRPESLVYRVNGEQRTLVSVMYILPPGTAMSQVPDLGDERAQWHRHTNLCWEGRRVAGLFSDGRCLPGGVRRDTPPMLHVWLTPQRCGPFAGLGVHGDHCREN